MRIAQGKFAAGSVRRSKDQSLEDRIGMHVLVILLQQLLELWRAGKRARQPEVVRKDRQGKRSAPPPTSEPNSYQGANSPWCDSAPHGPYRLDWMTLLLVVQGLNRRLLDALGVSRPTQRSRQVCPSGQAEDTRRGTAGALHPRACPDVSGLFGFAPGMLDSLDQGGLNQASARATDARRNPDGSAAG